MIAARLNAEGLGRDKGLSRFVALVHTEGCGVTGAEAEAIYARAMMGYVTHPLVRCAVLLEHGCEKTHNDYFRNELAARGLAAEDYGWASVQLDGGIDKVGDIVADWFRARLGGLVPTVAGENAGLDALRVGLAAAGPLDADAAAALARLTRWLNSAGATVVVPERGALLDSDAYVEATFAGGRPGATLAHGAAASGPGCHVLETPTDHWTEIATGLGATGVEMVLVHAGEHPVPGHPLVPLLQVSAAVDVRARYGDDLDLGLAGPTDGWAGALLEVLVAVASRRHRPATPAQDNIDFQFTRGLLGVSM
jgi:altronate dehydratase